jgi:formylglycine-generating enzyme required for sulfatase activity
MSTNDDGSKYEYQVKRYEYWFKTYGDHGEWCEDWYDENYYTVSPLNDPPGAPTGVSHVLRGGDWDGDPIHCRSSRRYAFDPDYRFDTYGFRVVVVNR